MDDAHNPDSAPRVGAARRVKRLSGTTGGDHDVVATLARIHGRVQGVGYRYWTATKAETLNLRGYVRNLTDGTVEALLIGDRVDVARMLAWCEEGPSSAAVDRVVSGPPSAPMSLDYDRFRRMRTAPPGTPV